MKNLILRLKIKNSFSDQKIYDLIYNQIADKNYRVNFFCNFKLKCFMLNFHTCMKLEDIREILEKNYGIFYGNDIEIFETKFLNKKILTKKNEFEFKNKKISSNETVTFLSTLYSYDEKCLIEEIKVFKGIFSLNYNYGCDETVKNCTDNINIIINENKLKNSYNFFEKIKLILKNNVKTTEFKIFIYNLDGILEKISDKGFKSLTDEEINFLNNYTDTI